MYAIKDAMIAKEHANGGLDCAIFYMDIRTFGKEYEKYYLRARDKAGVRFIQARVHSVDEAGPERSLQLRYVDDDGEPAGGDLRHGGALGRPAGAQGHPGAGRAPRDRASTATALPYSPPFMPVATSRPGVYACGVFQGPKDIPGSVAEASAAAGAGRPTAGGRPQHADPRRWRPPPRSTSPPRSRASGSSSATAASTSPASWTCRRVVEYARTLPHVVLRRSRTSSPAARTPRSG
ncbi:MAG: hypothetical protein MZU91_08145 [Desulfosudis oleivorans]|nr:hypothetical protein [Desulfosudis oleivorans]